MFDHPHIPDHPPTFYVYRFCVLGLCADECPCLADADAHPLGPGCVAARRIIQSVLRIVNVGIVGHIIIIYINFVYLCLRSPVCCGRTMDASWALALAIGALVNNSAAAAAAAREGAGVGQLRWLGGGTLCSKWQRSQYGTCQQKSEKKNIG